MKNIINKYPVLLLVLISLGLFALNLGELKVSIMEARNFIVSREMLTENHWILTTMNGIARYEKPPFPAWFTAPFAYIFGLNNVWAYRLPTSIFSILGIVYFFKLVKIWMPREMAFYSALLLGTSFYFIAIRFEAPSDMYTHVNMIIGLYFLLKHHPRIHFKNILLGGFFFGLSVLSKGPVSPYALFLPFIMAYFISFKIPFKSHLFKIAGFLIVGIILGGSWYLYVRLADPQTLMEVANKETGNWTSYNTRPFYYYWSFFIQSGIWTIPAAIGLAYPYFIKRIKHTRLYKFSFIWTILALVLLSVIPEKKPRYLLPVLFPLAINTYLVIHYLINERHLKISKILHYVHYSVIMAICVGVIVVPFVLNILWTDIWFVHILMSLISIFIAFYTFKFLKQKRFKALLWVNIYVILMMTVLGQSLTNVLKANEDYRSIAELEIEQKSDNSYHYGTLPPEIIWAYGSITTEIKPEMNIEKPSQILVTQEHIDAFKSAYPNLTSQVVPGLYDQNFFRTGKRKRKRFVVYVYHLE